MDRLTLIVTLANLEPHEAMMVRFVASDGSNLRNLSYTIVGKCGANPGVAKWVVDFAIETKLIDLPKMTFDKYVPETCPCDVCKKPHYGPFN